MATPFVPKGVASLYDGIGIQGKGCSHKNTSER